jgi:hypothetical protein
MKNNLSFFLVFIFIILYTTVQASDLESCCPQPEPCAPVLTYSPPYCFVTKFSTLVLKPGSSNMHYAAEAIPLPLPSPNWNIYDIDPGYHFGFDICLGFSNHENCVSFFTNWQHFKSCSSAAVSVGSNNMVGPFFEIGPDATPYNKALGNVQFKFNELNVNLGQYVEFGECLKTIIFVGVGMTSIKQKVNSLYSNSNGTIVRRIIVPSNFFGAGPQLGIDFSYDLIGNFYLAGKGLCSLLSGKLKNHTFYLALAPELEAIGVTPPNKQQTCVNKRTAVVPAFEQKIGVGYSCCDECFSVYLEAGFQSQIYISALQSIDMGSEVVTPPVIPDTVGVFARTFQRTISNFSLAGAYISLDVRF